MMSKLAMTRAGRKYLERLRALKTTHVPAEVDRALKEMMETDPLVCDEARETGHRLHGRSLADVRPEDDDVWLGGWSDCYLIYLDWPAKDYYLPAIIEQALVRPDPPIEVDQILHWFRPPPDKRKRHKILRYAREIRQFSDTNLQLVRDLIELVLNHSKDEGELDMAQKCAERFWNDFDAWMAELRSTDHAV